MLVLSLTTCWGQGPGMFECHISVDVTLIRLQQGSLLLRNVHNHILKGREMQLWDTLAPCRPRGNWGWKTKDAGVCAETRYRSINSSKGNSVQGGTTGHSISSEGTFPGSNTAGLWGASVIACKRQCIDKELKWMEARPS